MLGVIRDYLFPWQIPIGLLFAAAWVYGGGLFLQRGVRNKMPSSFKTQIGYCSLVSALAGCAGVVAGYIIFISISTLGQLAIIRIMEPNTPGRLGMSIVGIVAILLGALALLAMSYAVIHAMFTLTLKQSFALWGITLLIVAGSAAVLMIPTGYITFRIGKEIKINLFCQNKLQMVYAALKAYEETYGDPPETLSLLYEKKPPLARETLMDCPGGRKSGYFYLHPRTLRNISSPTKRILVCDFADNHHNGTRNVLFLDGTVRQETYSTDKFQELLNEPENAEFARMLKAAEGGNK